MKLIGDWPLRCVADDAGNGLRFTIQKHLVKYQAFDCRADTRDENLQCLCLGRNAAGKRVDPYHSAIEIGTFDTEAEALSAVAVTVLLGPPDMTKIDAKCRSSEAA